MGAIYKRELSGYFNSAIGYVVLAVYYFFSGLFFYLYCFYRDSASLGLAMCLPTCSISSCSSFRC